MKIQERLDERLNMDSITHLIHIKQRNRQPKCNDKLEPCKGDIIS